MFFFSYSKDQRGTLFQVAPHIGHCFKGKKTVFFKVAVIFYLKLNTKNSKIRFYTIYMEKLGAYWTCSHFQSKTSSLFPSPACGGGGCSGLLNGKAVGFS